MEKLLDKFASLIIKVGVNLQPNQPLLINAPIEAAQLVRKVVKEAYLANSVKVIVNWSDAETSKEELLYASVESLQTIPGGFVERYQYLIENNAALLSITSPNPGLMKDVDPKKAQAQQMAVSEVMKPFRNYSMNNQGQWCVVAYPNEVWAKKVFPDLDAKAATKKLLDAILAASHVTEDNDPVAEWKELNENMTKRNQKLNDLNFVSLHFKNSLGTDLEVGLVENHIWAGGKETAKNGAIFNPNIPTEENFCMPHNLKTQGRVVATKPLNYQGKLIENFVLDFKDGKVVNYTAEKEIEALKNLIEFDEGSSRLGEVALIPYDSPINAMNILFYNTLFDENASCHLALGASYQTTNLKGAEAMTKEELIKAGSNFSMTHVDFMFGSRDMEVYGTKHNGEVVKIIENGNFII